MSEETQDPTAETAIQAAPETPETGHKIEPIRLELEDLTEEGKQKAEKALHRAIADMPYTLASQETLPGSVVALRFEVARDAFDAEQERLLGDLRKEVTLPGFRKGKATLKLLQKRMGEDAVRDTVRSAAINVLRQENAKQHLNLLTRPEVVAYNAAETVSFEVEAEIEPVVEVKEYKGFTVEVEIHPVTDEMIDAQIDGLRRRNAVLEVAAEDAALGADDVVKIDMEVYNERGELMENMTRTDHVVYNHQRELPQAVAEQLVGKTVGTTLEVPVEQKSTNRRGEEVVHTDTWKITIKEIKTSRLPGLDDEFAKDLGDYESLADLREKTRKRLEESEEERQRNEALQKINQTILERNPVDAPRTLLANQTYRQVMQDQQQLERMGMRLEHVVSDADQYLRSQRASAEETVKMQLLLSKLAEVESLLVSDEDVDKAIEAEAERTGRKALAVRARLEAQKQLDQFRQNLAFRKLADFLLANNTVEKVAMREKPAESEA